MPTATELPIDLILARVVQFCTVEDIAALCRTSKHFSEVQVVLSQLHNQTLINRKSWPINSVTNDRSDPYGIQRGVRRVTHVEYLSQIRNIPGLTHITFGDYFNQPLRVGDLPRHAHAPSHGELLRQTV